MQEAPTIWVGLCLTLAVISYALGYSARALKDKRRRNRRTYHREPMID